MRTPIIVACALLAAAAHAQVYKCQEGGKTVYSQAPCAGAGVLLDAHRPTPGVAATPRAPAPQSRPQRIADERPAPQAQAACPSEQEIANMQTSASSRFLSDDERRLQNEDIRRARACQPVMSAEERSEMLDSMKDKRRASRSRSMTCVNSGAVAVCN